MDPGVGADKDTAVDGFLDGRADGGETVAAHEEGGVGWNVEGRGGAGGDVVFDHGRGFGGHGRRVETCCEGFAEVGVCDEEGVQVVGGFVVVGDVVDWGLGSC